MNIIVKSTTCGVYVIINKVNRKLYFGQSSEMRIRWNNHKIELRNHTHHNAHLQRAWDKYGEDNFIFLLLTECDRESLNTMEELLIQGFDSSNPGIGYNMTSGGEGHTWSEEQRKQISQRQEGKNNSFYGHKHTEETKQKWKESRVIKHGADHYNFGNKRENSTSKFKGVTRRKTTFEASITYQKKSLYLGRFKTEEEAAKAYDLKAFELYGDKAKLNFAS